jgi:rhodanese-related sulfurtransferase
MSDYVDADTLKTWQSDGRELALLDVREFGQYGERHLFFAVSVPYSVFELKLPVLVPNPGVRLVLYDEDDGVAERAAERAKAMGYTDVHILRGGAAAWEAAGYTLFAGVNVPSKAFGELIEVERRTPHVTADELKAMIDAGEKMVIVDGRTFAEFQRVSIPGGRSCPNGELALRIDAIAPDPDTRIVVNCAGRTRSIIGAQTLIDLAVPNPVVALENGTQGWSLAGLELRHGALDRHPPTAAPDDIAKRRARVRALAEARGSRFVETSELADWLKDTTRTTYLIDIRGDEEFAATGLSQMTHAPGGQLVQATDHWIGVRGARIVVADSELVRAPVIAAWLRQLGHEAYVLAGGVETARGLDLRSPAGAAAPPPLPTMTPAELKTRLDADTVQVVDLRASLAYREAHIGGSVWSIRPRLAALDRSLPVVLVADEPDIAQLAAIDLAAGGIEDIRRLEGGVDAWRQAGLPLVATPDQPADADRIDFLFFTHRRLSGDPEHSRQYLAWEIALVDQLDEDERAAFAIVLAPAPTSP